MGSVTRWFIHGRLVALVVAYYLLFFLVLGMFVVVEDAGRLIVVVVIEDAGRLVVVVVVEDAGRVVAPGAEATAAVEEW